MSFEFGMRAVEAGALGYSPVHVVSMTLIAKQRISNRTRALE